MRPRQVVEGLLGATMLAAGFAALAGDTAGITSCRIGNVELLVGGQSYVRQCRPEALRRVQAPVGTASGASGVAPALQLIRDQERRRILEAELTHEQENLAQLQRSGTTREPAAVTRTQENIAALNRELTRLPPSR